MTEAGEERTCEVCKVASARKEDLLCPECSRAFMLMLELLHSHPELALEDLTRVKEVFEWRMGKYGLTKPQAPEETAGRVASVTPPASSEYALRKRLERV